MLKKRNRLLWKDINFLFKRQQIIPWNFFSFFYFLQYPNKDYNQFSYQIWLKFSKRTVHRNLIKRMVYKYVKDKDLIAKPFWWKYYKIFIITNKTTNPMLKKLIETENKNIINDNINNFLDESFKNLINRLWNKS